MLIRRKAYNFAKNAYTKYMIKFPILVFVVIFVGFFILYTLISSTNTDVFKTFTGNVSADSSGAAFIKVEIPAETGKKITPDSRAFWYTDKQKAVFDVSAISISDSNDSLILELRPDAAQAGLLAESSGGAVKVDIAVYKQSLFDRVMSKGVVK